VNRALGTLGDQGLSLDELTRAAVLQQIGAIDLDPKKAAPQNLRLFRTGDTRHGDRVGRILQQELIQAGQQAATARTEALGAGESGTSDLEAQVRRLLGPGAKEEDVQRFTRAARGFGTRSGLEAAISEAEQGSFLTAGLPTRLRVPGTGTLINEEFPREDVNTLRQLLTAVERIAARPTVQLFGPRFVESSKVISEMHTTNGTTQRDRLERR
jgi:hypothetical protein